MEKDDVIELKMVLNRIDEKLLGARKIYSAMSFTFWLLAMLIYFAVFPYIKLSLVGTLIYWVLAIIVYIRISSNISRKVNKLRGNTSEKCRRAYTKTALLAISWSAGILVGWVLVPNALSFLGNEVSIAIGFLLFIAISLSGQYFFIYSMSCKKHNFEMLPSVIVPLAGIPGVFYVGDNAVLWSGFIVAIGFTLTVLLYLNSAFKNIG